MGSAAWAPGGSGSGGGAPRTSAAPSRRPTSHPTPNPSRSPRKQRLVAQRGSLVYVEEAARGAPNGSAFTVTAGPGQGKLDATNLVVGRVTEGQELVNSISRLRAAAPTTDSPLFKIAQAAGDRRADVAEKFFGRPFQRVVITASGVQE